MAGQKETVDTLLAESFKELACQQAIENITFIFKINMSCWNGLSGFRF